MKTKYMKPSMNMLVLKQHAMILAGSNYNLNDNLQDETVDEGW